MNGLIRGVHQAGTRLDADRLVFGCIANDSIWVRLFSGFKWQRLFGESETVYCGIEFDTLEFVLYSGRKLDNFKHIYSKYTPDKYNYLFFTILYIFLDREFDCEIIIVKATRYYTKEK